MVCVPKAIMKNHALRAGVNLEYSAPPEDTHACEVCGHLGTERHHWAPYYLFGNESEAWPKSFLCQACHAKWHRIIASQQAIA
jgi:hypothetical protein